MFKAEPEIAVKANAPQEKQTKDHTDIALTGLFGSYIALLNSERQAIWQRYNIFVLANSIILGFLVESTDTAKEVIFMTVFGFLLCALWYFMTESGYNVYIKYRDAASRFSWTGEAEANPILVHFTYASKVKGGWIRVTALAVIALFALGYIGVGFAQYQSISTLE